MNEIEFNLIAKSDLDKLNQLISKGYFETSDFEQQINVVCESLATLGYVIRKRGK